MMSLVLGACGSSDGGEPPATSDSGAVELPSDVEDQVEVLLGTSTTIETTAPDDSPDPEGTPQDQGVPGVTDDRILFGQSAAFSGPAQELGTNMRYGIRAAFAEVNEKGGVHGRLLELVTLDDAYEPEAAITNSQALIYDNGVFALIGAVGTPTSRSATPVAKEAGVPYIAPFTGAGFLRDAVELGNVVNLRASYNQETEEMVKRLIEDLGITRISVLFQDDSFGRAGYNGVLAALDRRDMELTAVGSYTRNTTAIKTAMLDIKLNNPDAVIIVGAYEPAAAMISWSKFINFNPVFINISFVGSNALAQKLGAYGVGVFVTQVVPFPTDDSVPVVAEYLAALDAYAPRAVPGFVSLEGYLAGRLAIAVLERCGPDVSRDCFTGALQSRETEIDLNGFALRYGENDNQGSDSVFWTVLRADGRYYPIDNLAEAR
ncbi:MAG: ABC transporter substrate-binding protein [bacterium]|nr:ABC transporter substrate-binding protein [bacterium]